MLFSDRKRWLKLNKNVFKTFAEHKLTIVIFYNKKNQKFSMVAKFFGPKKIEKRETGFYFLLGRNVLGRNYLLRMLVGWSDAFKRFAMILVKNSVHGNDEDTS